MKTKFILIAISLAANIALALAYFHTASNTHEPVAATIAATPNVSSDVAAVWTELRTATGDDSALVTRLRAEGFPPAVVRAIINAQISERFAAQRRELETASGELAYWKSWSMIRSTNPESRAALRRLYREQSDLLRQLLGDDATFPYARAPTEQRYGKLPKQKAEQLELIVRDYSDLMQQVQTEARGLMLPEDKERLAYLAREQQKDLASLLTPEELANYELRSSRTAQNLKYRLNYFDASEPEYVAIYKIQKVYDDRFNLAISYNPSTSSAAENKERSEAQKQIAKDLEVVLGAARYTDYKITTDYEYRQVIQLAERLNLPATTAKNVVGLKLDVTERTKAIRSDQNLDKQQREAQLAALAQDVTAKLTQQLGTDGFTAYRDAHGYWIKSLTPSPNGNR